MTTRPRFFGLMVVAVGAVLIFSACASGSVAPPEPTPSPVAGVDSPTSAPTAPPTPTPAPATPTPNVEPTPEVALQLTPLFVGPSIPVTATTFADIPGNLASGKAVPDFQATLMDRGAVRGADWRGSYLLLIPSVAGCGECMVNLYELTSVYSPYQGRNVKVAFLSIYPGDEPDVWRPLADYFPDLDILWGTVDPNFVIDYDIQGLGAVLMIDPEGRLVFRSDTPLNADGFEELLALATR